VAVRSAARRGLRRPGEEGLTLTTDEQTRADALLALASQLIQEETRQTIALVTGDVLSRKGSFSSRIRLKERPVVSVASVVLDGVTMDPTSYYIDRDELVRRNWSSAIIDSSFGRPWAGWGFPYSDLVITYTHGFAVVPGLVKQICMEMVVRVWANPGSVIQESVAGVQTTYAPYSAPPRGLLLTAAEKSDLRKRLGRPNGSISLR
jgi:hypothetical protein